MMNDSKKLQVVTVDIVVYVALFFFLLYFIGMRGEEIGTDTSTYLKYFDYIKYGDPFPGAERIEIGFRWLTQAISYFTESKTVYLMVIFFIQFVGITSTFNKKNKLFKPYLLITLVWLAYPFFYSITLNVIRQGLAFVFVIYAIDAKLQGKKYTPYLFLFLGVMFHYATLLYVFCFLMLELKLTSKQLVSFWFACLISAAFGLTRELAPWVASALVGDNSYFMSYIDSTVDSDYDLGFRFQFVIFSALPIAYYYLSCPFVTETQGNTYIFRLYLAMNILYLFTTSLPFSDRFALASWLLIPFMINLEFLQAIQAQRKLMGIAAIFASIVFSYYLLT